MADYDLKSITADTDGPSADTELLFGSPDQSSGTPKPYSFAGIKTWIAAWGLGGGAVKDSNANELISFTTTASAVNEVGVTNAATGNSPIIAAAGGDTNIDLSIRGKGTGIVKYGALGSIAMGTPQIPYFTNANVYLTTPSTTPTNSSVSANVLCMMPIFVPYRRAFTTLAAVVQSAGAGSTVARLGLYNANQTTGKPTTLIEEGASTIAVDSTGVKTATISQTLDPGLYYLAFNSNGAPAIVSANSNGYATIGREFTGTSGNSAISLYRSLAYAAFGDETASTWTISGGGGTSPLIGIR